MGHTISRGNLIDLHYCFVFNSNNTKKSFISGGYFGLQLLFYVGFNENLDVFNSIYWRGGFAKVENASFLLDDTFDGISLAPGTKSQY